MDVLEAESSESVAPITIPDLKVSPNVVGLEVIGRKLAEASKPVLIIGDGISDSEAQTELTKLAYLCGAVVFGAESSVVNMSYSDKLWGGNLGHMFGEESAAKLVDADVVLIVGTYVFPEVFPKISGVFKDKAFVAHIDLDTDSIAKNFPVDIGLVGDPKISLTLLLDSTARFLATSSQRTEILGRIRDIGEKRSSEQRKQLEDDLIKEKATPDVLQLSFFMRELSRVLPGNSIIFDEAITYSPVITRYIPPQTPGQYYATRGGCLGTGVPGAIGLKLAHPKHTVFGFVGDGGSMYTIQGLYTAARYNIDVKFIICNNSAYRLLEYNLDEYRKSFSLTGAKYPDSFQIPNIGFTDLAKSLGVKALKVTHPTQVKDALRQALAHNGPFLLDVVIP